MLRCFDSRYEPLEIKSQSSWDIKVVWATNKEAAVVSETQCAELGSNVKELPAPGDHTSKSSCWAWPGWKGVESMLAKSALFMVWKAGVGGLGASKE